MKLKRSHKSLRLYINWLQKENKKFTINISHKTYTIKYKNQSRTFLDSQIPISGLNLIQSVRKYVKDNNIGSKFPKLTDTELRIQYICFNKSNFGKNIVGVKEIDIEKAYWNTAFMKGIIDKNIFDVGMEISKDETKKSKMSRVMALGALAKEIKQRTFNGSSYEKPIIIEDSSETKHLWNHICSGVDNAMKGCMESLYDDFCFFWTDAIFFIPDNNNEERIKDIIKNHGYGSKTVNIEWCEFRNDACYVFSKEKGGKINDTQYKNIDIDWVVKNVDLRRVLDLSKGEKIPTSDKLKKAIQKKLKVRNFCYAITNEDIWRNRKINIMSN